jgi:hypothetical protein
MMRTSFASTSTRWASARSVIAAVAAVLGAHPLPGLPGEHFESLRCDARSEPVDRILGPLCVGAW